MEKPETILFDFKEVATQLVKQRGIHEGLWALYFEFGITGANLGFETLDGEFPLTKEGLPEHVLPTAIVSINKIGLAKAPYLTSIAVDAAIVNPKPKGVKKK